MFWVLENKNAISVNKNVKSSTIEVNKISFFEVNLDFNAETGRKFEILTQKNIGLPLVISIDDKVLASPIVRSQIMGGRVLISSNFSADFAKGISIVAKTEAIPVGIYIESIRLIDD